MPKLISRRTIERFIAQKRLHNVVGFFEYISEPRRMELFADYAKIDLAPLAGRSKKFLFHGSQTLSDALVASRQERFIYATDDPNYAIFLAVLDLRNAWAGVFAGRGGTKLTIDTDFVNGPSALRPGWVHILAGNGFKKTTNHEYVSKGPAAPLFAIPVQPGDLTVPIFIKN